MLLTRIADEVSGYSVVFDDDGRVAYAYLQDPNETIVSDVWLYNHREAPTEAEWHGTERGPYANPASYVREDAEFAPIEGASHILIVWESRKQSNVRALIFLRGREFAVLEEGVKPGWSVLAKRDGPLARVLRADLPPASSQ